MSNQSLACRLYASNFRKSGNPGGGLPDSVIPPFEATVACSLQHACLAAIAFTGIEWVEPVTSFRAGGNHMAEPGVGVDATLAAAEA